MFAAPPAESSAWLPCGEVDRVDGGSLPRPVRSGGCGAPAASQGTIERHGADRRIGLRRRQSLLAVEGLSVGIEHCQKVGGARLIEILREHRGALGGIDGL